MFATKPRRVAASNGYVYPDSGIATPGQNIGDIFGPRPFSPHIATVGYDYDFHRGIDFPCSEGDTVYAPCGGTIMRLHRSHFGFEDAAQLDHWVADQDGGDSSATFTRSDSNLVITGTRGGVGTFPSVAKYKVLYDYVCLTTEFEMRVKLGSTTDPAAGKFGFAIIDETTNEYIGVEWDGVNATALGTGSGGAVESNGTTRAVTTEPWLRFLLSSGTLSWGVSSDGSTWTDIDSEAMPAFTSSQKIFVPILYWRSTDTDTPTAVISVDFVGWRDADTIARFGNWIFVQRSGMKFMLAHFQSLSVEVGDIIEAGQPIGKSGCTGFDSRSGPVLNPHSHLEYIADTATTYSNDGSLNPLASTILPRANVSDNLTVTRTTANDPDAVTSWRIRVIVARAANDFDINQISCTGNLATRTINFNTRSGLNTDNDIPKESGVYIVPEAFDHESENYEISFYFNKSVVGTSFVSAYIKDTGAVSLWSE